MKRKIILVVYFVVLCFILFTLYKTYQYYKVPEFYFYSSMSFENGEGRRTAQPAIVTQNWYDEKLIERIEKKFVSMNGHPIELKIKLYYSRWHCKHLKPYATYYFEYKTKEH